jgi:hypothetical protein
MKDVPRPLLILVIVIIVLGVVACGIGVARGRLDAAGPTDTPAVQFGSFGEARVPARDVRAISSGCSRASFDAVDIDVSGSCVLRIDPQSLRPRSLFLRATSGSVTASITQKVRNETPTSDSDTLSSGIEGTKISIAGTSPVDVNLSCFGSCSVQILP